MKSVDSTAGADVRDFLAFLGAMYGAIVGGVAGSAVLAERSFVFFQIGGRLDVCQAFARRKRREIGQQVGLALATVSCNKGQVDLDWFKLPDNHHPVIAQNLYRVSGGIDSTERFGSTPMRRTIQRRGQERQPNGTAPYRTRGADGQYRPSAAGRPRC